MIYMNIKKNLTKSTQKLQQNNIPTPRIDAEILLSHILKKPREYIFTHPEKQLTKSVVMRYALRVTRRIKGEPIAYITGHKEFYGLDFYVNKNVLVPRPETELMIDEALKLATRNSQLATIIDVGTGSGCIIISLAKNLKSKFHISNFKILATDISTIA